MDYSILKPIFEVLAYAFIAAITACIVAVFIYFIQPIRKIPVLWMPERYNSNSTRKERLKLWDTMSKEEKKQARQDRFVVIVTYIAILAVLGIISYLSIRFIFPAALDFAQTII